MTLTSSTMRELGSPAPAFSLPDADGRIVSLDDFASAPALLVVFWCNHCPYVRHIKAAFAQFVREYQPKGLAVVAINSNDAAAYPEDGPDKMKEDIERFERESLYGSPSSRCTETESDTTMPRHAEGSQGVAA